MANSAVDICNMALSYLGNYGTVTDIEKPEDSKEIVFSIWYETVRKKLLRNSMPNFALKRKRVALTTEIPAFGYTYAYEYPKDTLKLLGIDDLDLKKNNYSVEGDYIYTNDFYGEGLPIRYVADIKDVTKFADDWAILLSMHLASAVAYPITQDTEKKAYIDKLIQLENATVGSVNSQENRPIRLSYSRFQMARRTDYPNVNNKK